MALTLTEAFTQAISKNSIDPIFVLKFEGIPYYYSSVPVKSIPKYDEEGLFYDLPGLYYDKPYISPKSKDYVIASESSNSISQQIEPDKAGGTSASNMTFKIVDFQQEMSAIISPGKTLQEFLGINCDVFMTVADGVSFPEDSVIVMHGVVEEASAGPGFVRVSISHPQNLLRQDFIPPWTAKLVENFEYKSLTRNGLRYLSRDVNGLPITLNFTAGGSTSLTVVNNPSSYTFNFTFINGVTTNSNIKKLITDNALSNALVQVEQPGDSELITAGAGLLLGDSNYIAVDLVDGFVDDNADTDFETYIKINDEILKVNSIDTVNHKVYIDPTTRGYFNSVIGVTGSIGDEVKSFYVLKNNAIKLALKLMLSRGSNTTTSTSLWGQLPVTGALTNAVYFADTDLNRDYGITIGDLCTIDGIVTDREIVDIQSLDSNAYLILGGADIGLGSTATAVTFKNKYNTLPIGCGISPKFIDVNQFETILAKYPSDIAEYRFFIEDSIDMKEFLESELLFPSSLYMIPRKGRISTNLTRPATGEDTLIVLDSDVVTNPQSIEIMRSVNSYYYNSIKWYYNTDSVNSDYNDKSITINADSVARFKRGVVPLLIESKGLRPDLNADQFIERNTRRLLDRYQNAPEYLSIQIPLGIGLTIEIGDPVLFGDSQTQITDTTNGTRDFKPRIFEVINKQQNQTHVRLKLLETNYGVNGRYGIFSPSSKIGPESTSTFLKLKKSYATTATELESDKWANYIGHKIMIHNNTWTITEEAIIKAVPADGSGIELETAVVNYVEDLIIEPANYQGDSLESTMLKWKSIHCFFNPQVAVTAGISTTKFQVSAGSASKFIVGNVVRIHNSDFTVDSGIEDYIIESVSGVEITLTRALEFTPAAGYLVELIGFQDGGKPYLYV